MKQLVALAATVVAVGGLGVAAVALDNPPITVPGDPFEETTVPGDLPDTNWYCGDPGDVTWGGQVIVIHCRQYESMLDGNDGIEPLAEMDLWINADALNAALKEADS